MGFSKQEYWSGLPCSPPGDLPDPGIETSFPALQADFLLLSHWGSQVQLDPIIISGGYTLEGIVTQFQANLFPKETTPA